MRAFPNEITSLRMIMLACIMKGLANIDPTKRPKINHARLFTMQEIRVLKEKIHL